MSPFATKSLRLLRLIILSLITLAAVLYFSALGYLYTNQRTILFANHREVEKTVADLPIQDVRIKTPDGETLQAWYEPPQKGKPVILFLHGQGAALYLGRYRYHRMHDHGVGYLALAYRGFSQSTGTPSEKGLFTDGLAAYDWLRTQGFSDHDIAIHGHSLGTGVATYVATQRPARALILEAPFTAATDVGQERYPYMPVSFLMKDKFLNRARIRDIHMPLLIAHGTHDTVIPFAEGKALYDRALPPKTFVAVPGGNHNTLTRDGIYTDYWRFLGVPLIPADTAVRVEPLAEKP
jgi:fermentation-respiration switch protein FrsA (DUF1100 family)